MVAAKYDGGMNAKFEFTETGDAVFSGKTIAHQQQHMLFFFFFFAAFNSSLYSYFHLVSQKCMHLCRRFGSIYGG